MMKPANTLITKTPPLTAHPITDLDTGETTGYYVAGHVGFDALARAVEFCDGIRISPMPPGSWFKQTYFVWIDISDPGEPSRWEIRERGPGARGAVAVTVIEW